MPSVRPRVDHPARVHHQEMRRLHPQFAVDPGAGEGRGPGAVDHQADIGHPPPGQVTGVEQRSPGNDRGPVLVVVKDGDLHAGLELLLDVEALRRPDILEIDAAEGRLQTRHGGDELVRVGGVDLDIEHVQVGKAFEKNGLCPPSPVFPPVVRYCPNREPPSHW